MNQPIRLSPDSLLAHEPFVRAVVRDLLRDEHRVQDVLQETWIRALHSGPSSGGSLKGWLASVARRLALDEHRRDSRRDRRERETARAESLESVDALHARLEAQREVVDAVLALEEPYKSVVLLAYYEQLAPQAIGERLGRSAATVRSQLSRAHEILRGRLDAHHGGNRSAWAGVLLPWAVATKSKVGLAVAAGIGVALIGVGAWAVPRVLTRSPQADSPVARPLAIEPTSGHGEVEPTPANHVREAITVDASVPQVAQAVLPDVSRQGLDQLRTLAVQTMRVLESRVLSPDPRFLEENKDLLALPDTGVTRILSRTDHGSTVYEGLIFPREGGAYFSFATRSHDYDLEPDLQYERGYLSSSFYGAMVGMVLPIGDVELASLKPTPSMPPSTLDRAHWAAWDFTLSRPETDDIPGARKMAEQADALRLHAAPARVGVTYLVRTWSPDEHDHLVGVRVLDQGAESVTIAWRVVARYPHENAANNRRKKPEYADVPAAPAWMESLKVEELVTFLHSIRTVSEPMLLNVDPELCAASAWLREGAGDFSGCFRVLPADEFGPLVEAPGKGAYYSIDRRAHVQHSDADIGRPDGTIIAGFNGRGACWILDLGELRRDQLSAVLLGEMPGPASAEALEKWGMLWETKPGMTQQGATQERRVTEEDRARALELRLGGAIEPVPGHSFLLRSIMFTGPDRLLLMTTLEASKDGTSLSWRELKRFDR